MSTPRQCRSCNSQMKDVRLCLVCYTAHQLDLPSNRGHAKIECANPWHGEGVAAPLEPLEIAAQKIAGHMGCCVDDINLVREILNEFAAAVSKNLQKELAHAVSCMDRSCKRCNKVQREIAALRETK